MKVSRFVSIIVLGAIMVSFLMMPSAALTEDRISRACSCSTSFSGNYYIGEVDSTHASAVIQVDHACNELTSYAGLVVWKYTTNPNNYRRDSFHADGASHGYPDHTEASCVEDYRGTGYYILGVEASVRAITTCGSRSHEYRYFDEDGVIPMSVTPPVVVE